MFTRKDVLERKTGEHGIGRYDFLKQLVNEFATTKSYDSKKQTLANLANFAYDPINFTFFKQLHILDLFLAQLSENNEELLNFAIAGLCNLSSDPENKEYIISLNGIYLLSQHLGSKNVEIKLNSLTTLYGILAEQPHLVTQDILDQSESFKLSGDARLSNLGVGDKVFVNRVVGRKDLEDFMRISGDFNSVHVEEGVVHGALLNSLVSGVIGTKLPGSGCLVVQQNLNFPKKCFIDEEIKICVELEEIRKIWRVSFNCTVKDKTVLYGDAKIVFNK